MATHPDFPDLTDSQRRALCNLADELRQRPETVTAFCRAAKGNPNGLKFRLQQYDRLVQLAMCQFPECRGDIPRDQWHPATTADIRKTLRIVDRDCCQVMDVDWQEWKYWLATGELSPLLRSKTAAPQGLAPRKGGRKG